MLKNRIVRRTMRILVTGANGQLGSELKALSENLENAEFIFTDRGELDITNAEAVSRVFKENSITCCINCAAYTAVDKAEEEDQQLVVRGINIAGVQNIARACEENDALLVHISSDYVYHNSVNRPLLETDPTEPKGIYARTKLDGDRCATSFNSKTVVLRVSWLYSSFGNNFVKTMIRLGESRDALSIVYDQIGTPTYAGDVALTIFDVIRKYEKGDASYGVFNFSNEGVTTWYDFASEIFRLQGISCNVSPILSKDYPTAAERPHFSVMDKSKVKNAYGISIPHWRDSLEECLSLINQAVEH